MNIYRLINSIYAGYDTHRAIDISIAVSGYYDLSSYLYYKLILTGRYRLLSEYSSIELKYLIIDLIKISIIYLIRLFVS